MSNSEKASKIIKFYEKAHSWHRLLANHLESVHMYFSMGSYTVVGGFGTILIGIWQSLSHAERPSDDSE